MKPDDIALEQALELLAPLGDVSARRMFGGVGIFRQGLMFALIAYGDLYLKTDETTRARFEERDLPPFTYAKAGKQEFVMSYHQCPEEALANSERMRPWAEAAFEAAIRADEAKPPAKRKHRA